MSDSVPAQRFGPTSGTVTGVLGLVLCAGAAAALLVDDVSAAHVRTVLVLLAVAVLIWAFMLRPRVLIEPAGTLLLRNGFTDWRIPLASVTDVEVRAVMTVRTSDDGRYQGAGVGKSVRQLARANRPATGGGFFRLGPPPAPEAPGKPKPTDQSDADFAAAQVLAAAQRARDLGLAEGPGFRLYAVLEIVAFAAAVLAAVIAFVV
ncbi:hypothetical protein EFK50_14820 [Nocardioides marmoriginsengisoli]|uniref:PH domain-containing protein n=1 Tax=Nocardioides marmoriginsengisoli TaxID=661483 RepID=A0A3N0CHQ0_9ACTN|nr:hypothetical protein [Nocardioides marmoriginsengisoli]RNL62987.1 hypothetical protein EFK50_14820 [Nocardioides marmoriginsengisoli]